MLRRETTEHSGDAYATKNPLESIKPEAINQGNIGDCYFLASLAAVAQTQPEKIRDAITDNHDGTYTVAFPGAKGEKIKVDAPTQSELGLYNGGTKYGTWAAIMESAYGKYRAEHNSRKEPVPPQIGANEPGEAAPVIKLLTGHEARSMICQASRKPK